MNQSRFQTEGEDVKPAEVVAPTALAAIVGAEIDRQIATARAFPRSLDLFRKKALSLATLDDEVAESCFYVLGRKAKGGGEEKKIEGPSVRLAEIVAAAYGNLKVAARVIEITAREVVAEGVAIDLEANNAMSAEVRVPIVNRDGRRYSADMINVTANAACAKARRNAVFAVVPFAIVKPIYEQAKATAVGTEATLKDRREKTLAGIEKAGVSRARVFAALGVSGIDDINLERLEELKGWCSAIKDGERSVDEVFPKDPPADRFAKEQPKPAASTTTTETKQEPKL